ncbi:MAG: DUF1292 domain-containing protein [Lachnospiraceae bacterium]|nr:DUF1292 domain-containing protein [Lachnospiraceae bacterium]
MSDMNDIYDKDEVTLYLDDDTELRCDVIGIFPGPDDREYIAVTPQEAEDDEEPVVYLYRFWENPEDEEDIKIDDIESDEEFEAASKAYDEFLADEYLLDEDEEEE